MIFMQLIDFNNVNINDNPYYVSPDNNEKYKIENVIGRINAGLVGTFYINDDVNKPLLKTGDLLHLKKYAKLEVGDIILYSEEDKYFIRRILRTKEEYIYVAGETENKCYRLTKDVVIAKAIARERNNKSLSFNDKKKKSLYRFKKVKLSYFRVKNRVIEYQQVLLDESIKLAKKNTIVETKKVDKNITNVNINVDLSDFKDPDLYVFDYQNGIE
jgi:hypothetical protein